MPANRNNTEDIDLNKDNSIENAPDRNASVENDSSLPQNIKEVLRNLKEAKFLANSNNAQTVKKLLDTLGWSIKVLLGEEVSDELDMAKAREVQKRKTGIAKIQAAYVYYYARWMELSIFGSKPDNRGRIKNPETVLQKRLSDINAFTCKETQLFQFLLESNMSSEFYAFDKGHSTMAAHFLDSITKLKKDTINGIHNNDRAEKLTLDDFFAEHDELPKLESDNEALRFSSNLVANVNKDPLSALTGLIMADGMLKTALGEETTLSFNKDGKSIADLIYKKALEQDQNNALALKSSYDSAKKEGSDKIFLAMKNFQKARSQQKEKEQSKKKEEGPVKFEDELAMNMADYITGRIDAKEFARRDRSIRDRQPLKKNDNDLEQLDEVDRDDE